MSGYLKKRFGKRYCLNAEVSLLLHTQSTIIPKQVTVITKEGGTSVLNLPHGNSLLIYSDPKNLRKTRVDVNGLQALSLAETLCRLGPQSFKNNPREVEIGLNLIRDPGELLAVLLSEEGMQASAGRLAGALRFIGRSEDADRLLQTMRLSKYDVKETNPFEMAALTLTFNRERSVYSMRLASMWAGWRDAVLDNFPQAPGLRQSVEEYLSSVDERYVADAYNSLSIEGYSVTEELIERVAKQGWNPDANQQDQKDRDMLAVRGYYQAFQAVKLSIAEILTGKNAGQIVRNAHHRWHGELFASAVTAGLLQPYQLAGYRNGPVYIRNSLHMPLPREALIDAMETLFNLLEQEPEPAVRAVLGHHLFVFIHPYFDGNGRLGRFLMNAMLASGGYPWTIVRVERRDAYLDALKRASVYGDIVPFTRIIGDEIK